MLNISNGALPTTRSEDGAGELLDNELEPPLNEDEDESDHEDYSQFSPAELQLRLQEYRQAYHSVWCERDTAEAEVVELRGEQSELLHACDTQEEYLKGV